MIEDTPEWLTPDPNEKWYLSDHTGVEWYLRGPNYDDLKRRHVQDQWRCRHYRIINHDDGCS